MPTTSTPSTSARRRRVPSRIRYLSSAISTRSGLTMSDAILLAPTGDQHSQPRLACHPLLVSDNGLFPRNHSGSRRTAVLAPARIRVLENLSERHPPCSELRPHPSLTRQIG